MKLLTCAVTVLLLLSDIPLAANDADAGYHFALGKILAEEGAYQEALGNFSQAVALDPGEVFIHLEFSRTLFRLRRLQLAAEQVEIARRLEPKHPEVLRLLSEILMAQSGSDAKALELARGALEELREVETRPGPNNLVLGQIYLDEGEAARAAEIVGEYLAYRPSDKRAQSLRIEALLRSGQNAAAEAGLMRLLQLEPHSTRIRLTLADLLSKRGDRQGAIEALQEPDAHGRPNVEVSRRLALEYYRDNQLDRASELVEEVLERSSNHFGSLYLKSLILIRKGDRLSAIRILVQLQEKNPNSIEVAVLLSRSLEDENRQREAAECLARLSRQLRHEGRARHGQEIDMQLALLHSRSGEWGKTREVTANLLAERTAGEQPEIVHLHAEALARTGESQQALTFLGDLPSDFPTADRVQAQKAQILFNLGKVRAAGRQLRPLIGSTEPDGWMLAAEVYQRNEQYKRSIPLLERALEKVPDSLQLWFWLGAARERTGRKTEAVGAFRRVLAIDSEFAPALNYLGYMWVEKGENLEEAQRLVQQAVAIDPENGAYIDSLGWAYFQLQEYGEARQHLERAVELMPNDAVVLEHLGDVYEALGREKDARRVYERAVELTSKPASALRLKIRALPDGI